MYRIIVVGSEGFRDYERIEFEISSLIASLNFKSKDEIEIVTPELGKKYAEKYGFKVCIFYPDWDAHGKSAGYICNAEMADYASAEDGYLIAFWDGMSPEIQHMIKTAEGRGLKVTVIHYGENK